MHYCIHLLTKTIPTEEEIAKILQPFHYDNIGEDNDPVFTYETCMIGGRYKGKIKLKVDEKDEYYEWKSYIREGRNGKKFWSILLATLNKYIKPHCFYDEADWYNNMGLRNGYILVDGAKIKDILNLDDLGCYAYILPNGEVFARTNWRESCVENEEFDIRHRQALSDNMDGFLTILDIHE